MKRYFGVAFRATQQASKTLYISIEIASGRSLPATRQRAIRWLNEQMPPQEGWSDLQVDIREIPQRLIEQVTREAAWVDQDGAHRLYAIVLYLHNTQTQQGSVLVGTVMTWNQHCLEDEIQQYAKKQYPESDGWELVAHDSQEWDEAPRPHAKEPIQWVPPQITAH